MNADSLQALSLLIPDYLGGHLSEADREAVEAAMREHQEFRQQVEWERDLRNAIRRTDEPLEQRPDQLAFERMLNGRESKPRRRMRALPVGIAAALVAGVIFTYPLTKPTPQFETLTDQPAVTAEPIIRLAVTSSSDMQLLLERYGLELVTSYPEVGAADVRVPASEDLTQTINALRKEPAVRFVETL
ncbi:MAG: hypothetical protein AAFQ99_06460 [Pseudomonadota bacterium]